MEDKAKKEARPLDERDFVYVDYAIGGANRRNHVGKLDEVLLKLVDKDDAYVTMFRFDRGFVEHFERTKSVAGYYGPCWSPVLCIDVDDLDVSTAARKVLRVLDRVSTLVSPGYAKKAALYRSGSKGFHIELPVLGFLPPSDDYHFKSKALALKLAGDVEVDKKVYDNVRLWRAVGSVNTKTKERLTKVRVMRADVERIANDGGAYSKKYPLLKPFDKVPSKADLAALQKVYDEIEVAKKQFVKASHSKENRIETDGDSRKWFDKQPPKVKKVCRTAAKLLWRQVTELGFRDWVALLLSSEMYKCRYSDAFRERKLRWLAERCMNPPYGRHRGDDDLDTFIAKMMKQGPKYDFSPSNDEDDGVRYLLHLARREAEEIVNGQILRYDPLSAGYPILQPIEAEALSVQLNRRLRLAAMYVNPGTTLEAKEAIQKMLKMAVPYCVLQRQTPMTERETVEFNRIMEEVKPYDAYTTERQIMPDMTKVYGGEALSALRVKPNTMVAGVFHNGFVILTAPFGAMKTSFLKSAARYVLQSDSKERVLYLSYTGEKHDDLRDYWHWHIKGRPYEKRFFLGINMTWPDLFLAIIRFKPTRVVIDTAASFSTYADVDAPPLAGETARLHWASLRFAKLIEATSIKTLLLLMHQSDSGEARGKPGHASQIYAPADVLIIGKKKIGGATLSFSKRTPLADQERFYRWLGRSGSPDDPKSRDLGYDVSKPGDAEECRVRHAEGNKYVIQLRNTLKGRAISRTALRGMWGCDNKEMTRRKELFKQCGIGFVVKNARGKIPEMWSLIDTAALPAHGNATAAVKEDADLPINEANSEDSEEKKDGDKR